MKLEVSINGNTFTAEGEFALDDNLRETMRMWINRLAPDDTAQQLEDATARLRAKNDELHAATVAAGGAGGPSPSVPLGRGAGVAGE